MRLNESTQNDLCEYKVYKSNTPGRVVVSNGIVFNTGLSVEQVVQDILASGGFKTANMSNDLELLFTFTKQTNPEYFI